jgi:phage-related protein
MAKKTIWDISLEIAGKDTGARKAIRDLQSSLKNLQNANKQLGKDFGDFAKSAGKLALGVVAGVTAAGAATLKLAGDFAAAGDQAAKTADALGMGIEGYQRLRYAMSTAGVGAEDFDAAIQKMSNTIKMGAAGNAASAKQLAEIGLSAQKLAGMKPEEAFSRISDYMQTLQSDADRTRAAITLFGKTSGPQMMAAMRLGSAGLQQMGDEAQSLGIIISGEQARAVENYGSAMSRMQNAFGGLKNRFIGSAIGPITQAFDHLKDAMVEQGPLIQELGQKFGNFLGEAVKRLPEVITKIKEFGTWVKDTLTKVANFVGGFKNLAKILAGIAIAPTLISGLKMVFSFSALIQTGFKAIPLIMKSIGLAAGPISSALLPIIGIVAGIAAVIYTVVRNFDNLKQYVLDCIERIKSSFGGAAGGMAVDWQRIGEIAKTVLGAIMGILEGGVLYAIKTVMNVITSTIQIVIGAFKVLWNVVKFIFWPMETIIKVIAGFIQGGFSGALSALGGQFGKLGDIVTGIFGGLKTMFGGVIGFFKGQFENAIELVKRLFGVFGVDVSGVFNGIKGFISGAADWLKTGFSNAVNFVKGLPGSIADAFTGAFNAIKNAVGNVAQMLQTMFPNAAEAVKGAFQAIGNVAKIVFWPIETIIKTIVGLFTGGLSGAVEALGGQFGKLGERVMGVFSGIKNVVDGVKGFIGGIGDKVGGFVGGAVDRFKSFLPGHAEGGIFTHRHIAEIAERGAEAVIPLNRSPQGFDIWKQVGEIGGYAERMSQQTATASTSSTPPVMKAAAQRISGGENTVKIEFNQNNTFSGGTPDKETINQISAAGQQAADDFEAKFRAAWNNMMRDQRRVNLAS